MISALRVIASLFRDTATRWLDDDAPRWAAAIAYYTVFSLTPLLLVVMATAGFVVGRSNVRTALLAEIESLVGREGALAIGVMLENAHEPGSGLLAAALGLLMLLVGASGVFGELQAALNTIWRVPPRASGTVREWLHHRFLSFALVLGIGFLLLVSLVVNAGIAALGTYGAGLLPRWSAILGSLDFVASFLVVTALFALMYKVLPDARLEWKDVWIGAAVTSLLFAAGKEVIGLYLGRATIASAYGAAGSLVVLLVWIYYSAQIVLFGAEFTEVYAHRCGSRHPAH